MGTRPVVCSWFLAVMSRLSWSPPPSALGMSSAPCVSCLGLMPLQFLSVCGSWLASGQMFPIHECYVTCFHLSSAHLWVRKHVCRCWAHGGKLSSLVSPVGAGGVENEVCFICIRTPGGSLKLKMDGAMLNPFLFYYIYMEKCDIRVKGFGLLVVMSHCPVPPLPTDSDCHWPSVRVSCPVGRVGALMYALFPGKGCISVPCH